MEAKSLYDWAREIGQPSWRIRYRIDADGVTPVMRAGNCRLFSKQQIEELKKKL